MSSRLEERLDETITKLHELHVTLSQIAVKLDAQAERCRETEERLDPVEERVNATAIQVQTLKWLLGAGTVAVSSVAGALRFFNII